jgi:gamma-glutamyltranspeptidase
LGGGGFMLIRFKDGKTTAIDYREMAPASANRNVFLDANGKLIKGEGSSTIGYRASGVPGTPPDSKRHSKNTAQRKFPGLRLSSLPENSLKTVMFYRIGWQIYSKHTKKVWNNTKTAKEFSQ